MGFNVFRTECEEFLEGCGELKARALRCYCFWLISPFPRLTPVSLRDCIHLVRNVICLYGHYWAFARDRKRYETLSHYFCTNKQNDNCFILILQTIYIVKSIFSLPRTDRLRV